LNTWRRNALSRRNHQYKCINEEQLKRPVRLNNIETRESPEITLKR
jgi:hypothetical protein